MIFSTSASTRPLEILRSTTPYFGEAIRSRDTGRRPCRRSPGRRSGPRRGSPCRRRCGPQRRMRSSTEIAALGIGADGAEAGAQVRSAAAASARLRSSEGALLDDHILAVDGLHPGDQTRVDVGEGRHRGVLGDVQIQVVWREVEEADFAVGDHLVLGCLELGQGALDADRPQAPGLGEAQAQPVHTALRSLGECDQDLPMSLPEVREGLRPLLAGGRLELPQAEAAGVGAAENEHQRECGNHGTSQPLCHRPTPFRLGSGESTSANAARERRRREPDL